MDFIQTILGILFSIVFLVWWVNSNLYAKIMSPVIRWQKKIEKANIEFRIKADLEQLNEFYESYDLHPENSVAANQYRKRIVEIYSSYKGLKPFIREYVEKGKKYDQEQAIKDLLLELDNCPEYK